MRDPFSWSFPLGRMFGVTVRIHFLFPLVCLGLVLRVTTKEFFPGTWIDMTMILGLLFVTVLFHEMGHCFAARQVGGEASEVLLWPLGGLAACDVPHNPRAHFLTAFGGPAINLLICLVCGLAMAFLLDGSFRPTWNPLWRAVRSNEIGQIVLVRWNGTEVWTDKLADVVLARLFYVSWITFLLNVVLVGFPWDAGRMFQSALWHYVGYRQATLYAVFAGFICMFVLLIVAIVFNEVLVLFLAFFTYTSCKQEWITLETGGEESLFGYDFSQGYTSLERDEEPALQRPRRKKVNFFQRWLQRRAARKLQQQQENAEAEARRVDELLDKIQRHGKESLTDEEQRFLKRYADRMKNK
jgi:Zn-dependent protease